MKVNQAARKIAGIVVSTALIVGSLGTAAAFAANSSDAVPKDTVVSVSSAPSPAVSAATTQGTIQYSTETYSRADGSQNFTIERWYDPATKNTRSDLKEYNSDHQVTRNQSLYYLGGNEIIIIQRDLNNGNALSGTSMTQTDQPILFLKFDAYGGFDSVKAEYATSHWSSIGTEQTADGKTLNKISAPINQSYINDTTQANMQRIEYLDQSTGLPVKEELFEDSTGQYKLFSSNTYENKYVTDDGTIFKPDNIALTAAGSEVAPQK